MSIDGTKAHIDGTVRSREPTNVPAGAVLTVTLEDVSKMDAMSETLGTCVIDGPEQLPVSFPIEYDSTLKSITSDRGTRGFSFRRARFWSKLKCRTGGGS